jgi:hypothetical protein
MLIIFFYKLGKLETIRLIDREGRVAILLRQRVHVVPHHQIDVQLTHN